MNDQVPGTIRHNKLPPAPAGSPLAIEWNTYCREVVRLLAEGQEGKFLLLKGEEILGVYDTWAAAREAGLKRYLLEPFLVQQIRAEEPVLRVRGYSLPCRS